MLMLLVSCRNDVIRALFDVLGEFLIYTPLKKIKYTKVKCHAAIMQ